MNPDFAFGLYVFCMNYHGGQYSRLYRIMSKLRVGISDTGIKAISGNRHTRSEIGEGAWEEWSEARNHYRTLKRSKYATETR